MCPPCLRVDFVSGVCKLSVGARVGLQRALGLGTRPSGAARVRRGLCVGAMGDGKERGTLFGYRIVLVSPQEAGNVGSVCRLAANFECRDIWLVDPQCDYNGPVGHAMAANAVSRQLMENVQVSATLADALNDCNKAIAFTRRKGALRIPNMSLSEVPLPLPSCTVALVFGREDTGLTTSEVHQCTQICSIPSGKWEGSLNLSHAVAVVLSRLYESAAEKEAPPRPLDLPTFRWAFKTAPGSASIGEIENLLSRWTTIMPVMSRAAFSAGKAEFKDPERFIGHVRKILQRGAPSSREVAYLQGFLTLAGNVASVLLERTEAKADAKEGH